MKYSMRKLITRSISALLGIVIILSYFPETVYADNGSIEPIRVVSLGDSYSSGEGIEPFYGQEKTLWHKVDDDNWLAHRSKKSWPGLLKIPGLSTTMEAYNVQGVTLPEPEAKWYFNASSGAETKHFNKEKQEKKVMNYGLVWKKKLDKQLDIFKNIDGAVDYVTLTIGGNDVKFADIITDCVLKSTYLGSNDLENRINELWGNFDTTRANIKNVYYDIQKAAGSQAEIIVAGYPKLLDKEGKGAAISKKEATTVNFNVSKFNDKLEEIITECSNRGMNIYFVDVETAFDADGGHQAYSKDAWINEVMLSPQFEDLSLVPPSAYSIHPNELGAEAYAECVNEVIKGIEKDKFAKRIIKGSVYDENEDLVSGKGWSLSISSTDNSFVSDPIEIINGEYSTQQTMRPGEYIFNLYKDDTIINSETVKVLPSRIITHDIELFGDSDKVYVSGTVYNSYTDKRVYEYDEENTLESIQLTSLDYTNNYFSDIVDGKIQFRDVKPGKYEISYIVSDKGGGTTGGEVEGITSVITIPNKKIFSFKAYRKPSDLKIYCYDNEDDKNNMAGENVLLYEFADYWAGGNLVKYNSNGYYETNSYGGNEYRVYVYDKDVNHFMFDKIIEIPQTDNPVGILYLEE